MGARVKIARRPRLITEWWEDGYAVVSGGLATVLVYVARTNAAGRRALAGLAQRHGILMQCVDETHGCWQAYIPLRPPEGCQGDGPERFIAFMREGADTQVAELCLPDPPDGASPEARRNWARIRRAPRQTVPLVRGWEYVLDAQPPHRAMGAGGGDGWRPTRPVVRSEECDGGRSLHRHQCETGMRPAPGRKRDEVDPADLRETVERRARAAVSDAIRAALGADGTDTLVDRLTTDYLAYLAEYGSAPDLDELLAYSAERQSAARARADAETARYRLMLARERGRQCARWARAALARLDRALERRAERTRSKFVGD